MNYNLPRQSKEYVFTYRCPLNFSSFEQLDKSYWFSTAVSMFGALLRESKFIRNTSFDDIIKIGTTAINPNDLSQKEFLNLVDQAKKLYSKTKKKKEKEEKRQKKQLRKHLFYFIKKTFITFIRLWFKVG
jgi:Ca-activated chloride channel family protein